MSDGDLCTCGVLLCTRAHPYRVQMSVQHQIAADETFDSRAEAEAFVDWWFSQPDLRAAISFLARADVDGVRWHLPPSVELDYTLIPGIRTRFAAERELNTHESATAMSAAFEKAMARRG